MLASSLHVNEDSGSLDDEVDVQGLPRQGQRVAAGDDLDVLTVDGDGVVADNLDVGVEGAQDRVVLEQVRGLLDTSGVVDGDDLQEGVLSALPAAEELATNAAETVDGNLDLLDGNGHLAGTSTGLRKKREREEVLLELVDRCCWTKWC